MTQDSNAGRQVGLRDGTMIEERPEESLSDWLKCPKCGSEDVQVKNHRADEYRPSIHCNSCEYARYISIVP